MTDIGSEQGSDLEAYHTSLPPPTGRGSERWSWKNALIGVVLGVTTAGAYAELFWRYTGMIPGGDLHEARVALYPFLATIGGLVGFMIGGNFKRLF